MDYFYLDNEDSHLKSPRKTNLIRINKAINTSTDKKRRTISDYDRKSEDFSAVINNPMYNTFNFTKMVLKKGEREDGRSSSMDREERRIAGLCHTVALIS